MKNKEDNIMILTVIIIIAKVLGMFRDIVLANYFGTSYISDAYLIASSVPTLLFYFIGHSLSIAYIPMYSKVKHTEGKKKADDYSNNLINIAFLFCTFIVIFLLIYPNMAVKVFAIGFDERKIEIASSLIRISTPSIYLMTWIYVLNGYLQVNNQFIAPAAVSIPRNFVVILSIILASSLGPIWLGWGLTGAYVAELFLLLPIAIMKGYHYRIIINFKDQHIKDTGRIILPILFSMCVGQVNKIIDRSIASTVIEGGISALSYASVINNAIQEIAVNGIITVLFTKCSELVSRGEHKEVKKKLKHTINTMLFLLIPASAGVVVLAEPIVEVILNRGSFNAHSIYLTSGALRCYTVGLVSLAIRDTLVRVFYAYKDTRSTTATSVAAITINILLNLFLSKFWGINGLAIATSLAAIFNSVILYYLLTKKIGDFGLKESAIVAIKAIICSTVMTCAIYLCSFFLHKLKIIMVLQLAILIFVGMGIYFISSLFLKAEPIIRFCKQKEIIK